MRTRLGFATVLVALAAAALAGCGGGDDEQQVQVEATPEFLAQSARRTTEADTGRFEMRMVQEQEVPGAGTVFAQIDGIGAYDAGADVLSMDMTTRMEGGPDGEVLEGEGESVQDGFTLYYRGFPFTEGPDGEQAPGVEPGSWVSLELPDEVTQITESLNPGSGAIPSPEQELERLLDGVGDVEEVGTEEVRGVPTTHLQATYQLPEEVVDQLEALVPEGEGVDISDQPLDVWVDGEGIVRRIETGVEMEVAGMSIQMSNVSEYFDLGAEVDIEVPEDATPVEDLVGSAAVPPGEDDGLQAAEDALAEAEEQLAQAEADAAEALEGLPPEMRVIAEAMAQLTPEQLAEDPCQVVEDPARHEECETFLAPMFGG